MKRRTVLRRLGTAGALGTLGLAGCLSDGVGSSPAPTDTSTPTDPPMPEIDATAIETRGTDCTSGDEEVASLDADAAAHRLTVTGTIQSPNPCHLAELVETDLPGGTLSVVVGTVRDDQETCIECVGAVDYEATIELTAGLDAEVVVSHEMDDGRREMLRESVHL